MTAIEEKSGTESASGLARDLELDRDNQIWDAVVRALRFSGYGLLRSISCEVRGGVVSLMGQVPSFFLKQMAQEVVLHKIMINGLNNLVSVGKS